MLPKNAPFEAGFEVTSLAHHPLTGGQINLIIKNTAYNVAARVDAVFTLTDFESEIRKEKQGSFDNEKSVGFLNR